MDRVADRVVDLLPVGSSAQDFAKVMHDEYELYKQVVREANVKAE